MSFLIFRDFSLIFLIFSEFILDLFGFFKIKKIIFIPRADVAANVAGQYVSPRGDVCVSACV